MMAICLPTLFWVASANLVFPSSVRVRSTTYSLLLEFCCWIAPPVASATSVPSSTTQPASRISSRLLAREYPVSLLASVWKFAFPSSSCCVIKQREPGWPSSSRMAFASVTPGISTLIRSEPSWYTGASVLYCSTRFCSL